MIETYELVAPPSGARWLLWGVAALLVVAAALVVASLAGGSRPSVVLEAGRLEVGSGPFAHHVALSDVIGDDVRRVNLQDEPELALGWRTWGTALPGFRSGWFRLKQGGRAWVHFRDPSRVVVVPTRADHVLLLEPLEPAALVARLRSARNAR